MPSRKPRSLVISHAIWKREESGTSSLFYISSPICPVRVLKNATRPILSMFRESPEIYLEGTPCLMGWAHKRTHYTPYYLLAIPVSAAGQLKGCSKCITISHKTALNFPDCYSVNCGPMYDVVILQRAVTVLLTLFPRWRPCPASNIRSEPGQKT